MEEELSSGVATQPMSEDYTYISSEICPCQMLLCNSGFAHYLLLNLPGAQMFR